MVIKIKLLNNLSMSINYNKQKCKIFEDFLLKMLGVPSWRVLVLNKIKMNFLVFCVTLLCVFMFWVPWCDVHYDFHVKTMFGSSLPSVVCRRAHVLFTLFVFVCASWCPRHIMFVCFVCLCLVYPVLPVSLDCTFLIAPSIFSNVY
jgi:hypothetical protein